MNCDILVNKQNAISKDFIPENLVEYPEFNGVKIDPTIKTLVPEQVLQEFMLLKQDALQLGYEFVIDSCYRSYNYQQVVFEHVANEKGLSHAQKYVALPCTSEHQTGLAIDVALISNGEYNDQFDDTYPEIKWLHENCWKYGFIVRYPLGKEDITGFNYECWHIRYVGRQIAQDMHKTNTLTFEEYHQSYVRKRKNG